MHPSGEPTEPPAAARSGESLSPPAPQAAAGPPHSGCAAGLPADGMLVSMVRGILVASPAPIVQYLVMGW